MVKYPSQRHRGLIKIKSKLILWNILKILMLQLKPVHRGRQYKQIKIYNLAKQ